MNPGVLIAVAVVLAQGAAPEVRERVAVLILPSVADQTGLADNLTEVAISRLAERRLELVGSRELRRFLAAGDDPHVGLLCINQPACLARLGVALGVKEAVIGSVRSRGTHFLLTVSLISVDSAKVEAVFFRDVDDGLDALIRATQESIGDLFRAKPAPSHIRVHSVPDGAEVSIDRRYLGNTPLVSASLEPGIHAVHVEMSGRFPWRNQVYLGPGQDLDIALTRDHLVHRRRWAPPLAYGASAAALLSFAAAGVFAILGNQTPMGRNRSEAQDDLAVREGFARDANILLVTGGTLAAVSAFSFARFWRDVLGD